jgi:hypothetical protein
MGKDQFPEEGNDADSYFTTTEAFLSKGLVLTAREKRYG